MKVEELVERVGLTDGEIDELYRKADITAITWMDWQHKVAEAATNKVLNDPDLYLQITGEPILTMGLGKGDESYCTVSYISIADALKEE